MGKDFSVDGAFENSELQKRSALFEEDTQMTAGKAIRFHEKRYEMLKKHFAAEGLDFGAGVRRVCYEWMSTQ